MQWYEKRSMFPQIFFQRALKWNNPRTTLFVLEDVFQSSRLQNITVFLCTLYKMKKFRFYPLSHTNDPVFLNSPRRSPKPKKHLKDRGGLCWSDPCPGRFQGSKFDSCSYHHTATLTALIIWHSYIYYCVETSFNMHYWKRCFITLPWLH